MAVEDFDLWQKMNNFSSIIRSSAKGLPNRSKQFYRNISL